MVGIIPDKLFLFIDLDRINSSNRQRFLINNIKEWDHTFFSDPLCYEYYIDILEDVIEKRLTEAIFQAACERTGEELSRFLSRPQISAAMIELIAIQPQAIEPAVAKAEIQNALQELLFNFSRERVKLVERIASYRSARIGSR